MKYEEFRKKIDEDQELKEKFQRKLEEKHHANEKESWKVAADVAKDLGFDLDPAEFAAADRSSGELSLDELERVSGGRPEWCLFNYSCLGAWNNCNTSNECKSNSDTCSSKVW